MPLIIDEKMIEKMRRKKLNPKTRSVKPPKKVEREFRARMSSLWAKVLLPSTKKIQEMVAEGATPTELADFIETVLRHAQFQYDIASEEIVWRWRLSMDTETRRRLNAGLRAGLGIDIAAIIDDPVVAEALAVGGMDAVNLIKTIPQDLFSGIAQAVQANFTGTPLPAGRSLEQQIRHVGKVSKKRATLIARDQTSKMTGLLNMTRQTSLGIDSYIWRTSRDARVVGKPGGLYPEGNRTHGNHWIMEGVHCKWDDATVYSSDEGKTWKNRTGPMPKSHPGQDIQCRCHAEPIVNIEKLLQQTQTL